MGETNMAGVTGKKKAGKGSYLLLHRSGTVARTKTLTTTKSVDGIMSIINLETLEQYDGEKWEKIPDGYDALIEAEQDLAEEEEDYEEYANEEGEVDSIQFGARRLINPNLLWAYCKMRSAK